MWHKRNFPGEAVFRVYVAISAVRRAAAESVEHLELPVSRVGILLICHLSTPLSIINAHQSLAFCVVCPKMRDSRPCRQM